MPKAKEYTVAIPDKPGALGRCFLGLAEQGVNILAFQSYVEDRESLVRFLADDTTAARKTLAAMSMIFEETDVAVVRLANRPGALGRAAARLGENQINIDSATSELIPARSRYCWSLALTR